MKITLSFLLIIILAQATYCQNDCNIFKDYQSSQEWINEVKELNPEKRKERVLNRFLCEKESTNLKYKFTLAFIIDGLLVFKVPKGRDEILRLIPSENIQVANSNCEIKGIYANSCYLGFTLINTFKKPIYNNNPDLSDFKIKRKKKKLVLKFISKNKQNIKLYFTEFSKIKNDNEHKRITIRKGNNRIKIPKSKELMLVKINSDSSNTIILK